MKLKTRTNQPVYYQLPVSSNMEQLSDSMLNSLKVGDVVQKKTGNQKHCYIVTYKEEKHGICLSYFDGSGYMETLSYDFVGGHWVFNSKDVCDVHQAIEADKDIISQITMEYDSESDVTDILFPKGVMPLSITLNTHELFLKNDILVGSNGQEVEGYEFSDYAYIDDCELYLEINGDIREQVINGLSYILINGNNPQPIYNTYNLFFPASGGTKLYKHQISRMGAPIIVITNVSTSLTTLDELNNALTARINGFVGSDLIVGNSGGHGTPVVVSYLGSGGSVSSVTMETMGTDTVTEL